MATTRDYASTKYRKTLNATTPNNGYWNLIDNTTTSYTDNNWSYWPGNTKILGIELGELDEFLKNNKINLKNFKEYFSEDSKGNLCIHPRKLKIDRALKDIRK